MWKRTMVVIAGASFAWGAGAGCDEPLGFDWEVRASPGFDDVPGPEGAAEIPTVEGPCAIADTVFTPFCVDCHNGVKAYPDLRAGALGRLAGAAAQSYPGQILVVAGNADASFLYKKMHQPASGEGKLMPPDGAVSSDLLTAVASWINSGAPACAGVVDPGPVEPIVPVAGGTITYSSMPQGYGATHPAWAEQGTCTAQQWWQYQGDEESKNMHPGVACLDCHARSGGEAPDYSYAGTVFANVADTDDCRGVQNVKVEILDNGGTVLGTTMTNASGNFYWRSDLFAFRADYRARLSFDGRTREMTLPQASNGDCNTCHGSKGTEGAPGRMVVP